MIEPDDERHGTLAGYCAPCHCQPCLRAKADYENKRRYDAHLGRPRTVDATGTRRRLQALMAIGWTTEHIADAMGCSRDNVSQILRRCRITRRVSADVIRVYDRLSMSPGPSPHNRQRAARLGWQPPLAWDDIDNPDAKPYVNGHAKDDQPDEVVILRAMNGERVTATIAERFEIVRRWQRTGQTLRTLELVQGWPAWRYTEKRAA